MQTIGTEELIQYLYNETTIEQNIRIQEAIETDWNIKEEYEMLLGTIAEMKKVSYSPSNQTIESILKLV